MRKGKSPLTGAERAEVQAVLCERVATGELVTDVCRDLGIDRSTPYQWAEVDDDFRDSFRLAREYQTHSLAEQAISIAEGGDGLSHLYRVAIASAGAGMSERDAAHLRERLSNSAVNRDRLRVDSLKWLTSKIAPRLYGERLHVEATHDVAVRAVVALPVLEPLGPVMTLGGDSAVPRLASGEVEGGGHD